jgi:hypothetical protein
MHSLLSLLLKRGARLTASLDLRSQFDLSHAQYHFLKLPCLQNNLRRFVLMKDETLAGGVLRRTGRLPMPVYHLTPAHLVSDGRTYFRSRRSAHKMPDRLAFSQNHHVSTLKSPCVHRRSQGAWCIAQRIDATARSSAPCASWEAIPDFYLGSGLRAQRASGIRAIPFFCFSSRSHSASCSLRLTT